MAPFPSITRVLLVAALLGALTACTPRPAPSTATLGRAQACQAEIVSRQHLSASQGLDLYVEPRVVGTIEGGFLLAGQPTYAWSIGLNGDASLAARSDFFGVLVRGSRVEFIPLPPDVGPVGWVRGAATDDGRWAFIFQELDRPSVVEGEVVRVLFGQYGDDGWEGVQELEQPSGGHISVPGSSSIETANGDLQWATLFIGDRGGIDVLRYRRRRDEWLVSTVVESWADEVDLIEGLGGVTWLALAGLDPDFRSRLASLRLLEDLGTERESVHRIKVGSAGMRFRSPTLARSERSLQVGWLQADAAGALEAWIAAAPEEEDGVSAPPPTLVDDGAGLLLAVPAGPHGLLWATLHVDRLTGDHRIRLSRVSRGQTTRIADFESPFQGPFGISFSSPDQLLIVGPEAHADAKTPFVRSLVLRLNLFCDQAVAADYPPGP